jgi:hypothetical protein
VARRLAGLALACYPPSFRERYGEEIRGLVTDTDVRARTVADLAWGAARAWTRAVVPAGEDRARRRLQASVTTTWVAWCAGFLVTPAINRALLDPEPAHLPAGVAPLLDLALVAIALSAALVAVAAVPLLPTFAGAARRRDGQVLRPLLIPAGICAVELLGMLGIFFWRRTYPPLAQDPHFSGWFVAGLALWAAGFVVTLIAAGLGPAIATTRAAPSISALRLPGILALPVAVLLTTATAASVAAAVLMLHSAGLDKPGPAALVFTVVVLLTAAGASVTALTTAARGLPAARRPA